MATALFLEAEEQQALLRLRDKLKGGLSIKDRRWMLKTYRSCFVGQDCVKFLIQSNEATNEREAVILGRMLIAAHIIRHVEGDHDFKNENLFYRFVDDGPCHGKVDMDNTNGSDAQIVSSNGSLVDEQKGTVTEHKADITPVDCIYNQKLLNNVRPPRWINPTAKGRYNLIAIGAGAAGLISAASCAGIGGKSAIIEENLFGGDCLSFGCVPSKALLSCAKVIEKAVFRGNEFGLKFVNHSVDFKAIMQRMRRIRFDTFVNQLPTTCANPLSSHSSVY